MNGIFDENFWRSLQTSPKCLDCKWLLWNERAALFFCKQCYLPLHSLHSGVNLNNICARKIRAQDSMPFFGKRHLANGVHILANFDLILSLLLCWWNWTAIFFAERCALATFCLTKKFGEIDPCTTTATYNLRILERKGEEKGKKWEKSIPQKQKRRKGVGGKTEIKEIA